MSGAEVLKKAKDQGLKMIDLKFMDMLGAWQHFSVPIDTAGPDFFEKGIAFDGSSIRSWCEIHKSDMTIVPDIETFKVDPFIKVPTATFICDVLDPTTMTPYNRDPRSIAKKAEAYLKSTGIGDTIYFGPEPEFFIFDDVKFSQHPNRAMYAIDTEEGNWNSDREGSGPNLGYKPRTKEGYSPVPPLDSLNDIRNEIVMELQKMGLKVELQHHEVGSAGQCEIGVKFSTLLGAADNVAMFKYVVKNVARRNGKTATFMPKPLFGDNGSGMHCHLSIWKNGKNVFAGNEYAGLSKTALYFIGGLIKHGRALTAITNPTTNSFKRLVPGYEAPCNLAYSNRNRSAAIRIPGFNTSANAKRIEFRPPDPSSNPYLTMAAIMMAGLDGVEKEMHPGDPIDKNIYGLSKAELKDVPSTPASLEEAISEFSRDHEYLLKGDVFSEDLLSAWIEHKMDNEIKQVGIRPTPYEFLLYFDA
ncbi:MAG: type I glutamate--ammonia ligase [Oligoflexia bacterium]|nr:type I glutamate--ammonia ligase [Oligoflexia bacterium]